MSLKKHFNKSFTKNSLAEKSSKIREEVESLRYTMVRSEEKNRFLSHVDFTTASNFAKYGSAEKYYNDGFVHIYQTYPYDGSAKEKTEWQNNLLPIDKHIFDNLYPRTTGYATLGTTYGTGIISVSNYGAVASLSLIHI